MEFKWMGGTGFTATEVEELSKCLENLINVPEGGIPLARGMGMSWANLSRIPADMENEYATELIEKVEEFEPRVSVSEVTFSFEAETVVANITFERREEELW